MWKREACSVGRRRLPATDLAERRKLPPSCADEMFGHVGGLHWPGLSKKVGQS